MTAIRWFLSYLLPILLISSVAAGYFYRDQLSSDWYHTLSWPVTQINAVLEKQKMRLNIVDSSIMPTTSAITTSKTTKDSSTSKNQAENLILPKSATERTAITPLMHPIIKENQKELILPKSLPQKTVPAEKLAVAPRTPHYFMPYPQQRMMPPVRQAPAAEYNNPAFHRRNFNFKNRPAPKPPTKFKLTKKQQKLLYQARKAYWKKDIKNAKKHYLALTKILPNNPDVQGELGNLFYLDRKLESAIKHYALAAKLLVKHRHYWKLPQIMQIISRFNPAKAAEIAQLLHNNSKTTTTKKGK